ncbi:hypothetical protein [Streptomyces sp. NPDC053542]|uniref:hypothetical protein n=1 Tax=Streptomyces sp. NPDC053542 TaxID=3365710 RepID=UPI0037D2DA7E
MLRWLLFYLVCAAGIAGLPWWGPAAPLSPWLRGTGFVLGVILLPLASVLTPFFVLRRMPRNKRGTWQLLPMVVAAAGLGVLSLFAGQDTALQDRGRVTEAKVVSVKQGKTNRCTLQQPNGQAIPLDLKEGDGCATGVKRGDTLRVRYDPEGAANPVTASWKPASYGAAIAGLAALFVALGTWGGTRMSRRDREYSAA